ncbi:MAG: PKD domain-containing protein [Bacteroidia bacterium]
MKKLLLVASLFFIKQINAQCSLSITGNTVICEGNTTTLTVSGATNYTWMPSGVQTATIAITPTATTVYTVTGTTGTCTVTDTISVIVNNNPVLSFNTTQVCDQTPLCYTNTTANQGDFTAWEWHMGDGYTDNLGMPECHQYPTSGTYTIVLTATTTAGCVGTVTGYAIVNPNPSVDVVPNSFYCPNQVTNPINFTCHPAGGTPYFTWSSSNAPFTQTYGSVPSYTAVNYGTITYTVNATLNNCTGPNYTFSITVYPKPVANFSANMHICDGQAMQFTDLSIPNTGSITVNQWAWDFDSNGSIDSSSQNPSYIYPFGSAGTNTVTLYIGTSSAPSCTAQVTGQVYINANPVADFAGDSLRACSDLVTYFTNLSTLNAPPYVGLHYYWDFGNGNTSYLNTPTQQTYTNSSTTQNAYYTVSLTATTDSTCTNTITKTNYIEVLACASNGIEKYTGSTEVNIYPNPNNGNFVIETNLSDKQTVQILDVTGKLVLQQTINGKAIIDASSLDNGIYFVQLNTSEGLFTKKIIVQR